MRFLTRLPAACAVQTLEEGHYLAVRVAHALEKIVTGVRRQATGETATSFGVVNLDRRISIQSFVLSRV